jgi:hypothetical protein
MTLAYCAKFAEAEGMLQATLEAERRVLGNTHPHTLATARSLEQVRSAITRAEQPTKTGGKAAARRIERAATPALSLTALAEAEAKARAAEAELLAMLDLEEPEAGAAGTSGSATSGQGEGQGEGSGQQALIKLPCGWLTGWLSSQCYDVAALRGFAGRFELEAINGMTACTSTQAQYGGYVVIMI